MSRAGEDFSESPAIPLLNVLILCRVERLAVSRACLPAKVRSVATRAPMTLLFCKLPGLDGEKLGNVPLHLAQVLLDAGGSHGSGHHLRGVSPRAIDVLTCDEVARTARDERHHVL